MIADLNVWNDRPVGHHHIALHLAEKSGRLLVGRSHKTH